MLVESSYTAIATIWPSDRSEAGSSPNSRPCALFRSASSWIVTLIFVRSTPHNQKAAAASQTWSERRSTQQTAARARCRYPATTGGLNSRCCCGALARATSAGTRQAAMSVTSLGMRCSAGCGQRARTCWSQRTPAHARWQTTLTLHYITFTCHSSSITLKIG